MRPTIDNIRSVGDFLTLYQWNLSFIQFPTGVVSAPNDNSLNFRCVSSDIPKMTGQTITVSIRGHQVHQPGIFSYDPFNITFLETGDSIISQFLKDWREACWETQTGIQKSKEDVSAQIRIARLNRQDEEVWEYILIGAILDAYDPAGGPLGDQASEVMRPQFTLRYDYFIENKLL